MKNLNMTRSDWIILSASLVVELAFGYGIFLIYPLLAASMFGSDNALYAHANEIGRATAPMLILLFNVVIWVSNMDTPQPLKLNRVNRSLRLISGLYFGCYIVFLVCWVSMGSAV